MPYDALPITDDCLFATVAQLVEQRFRKPQVSGSRPLGGFAYLMIRGTWFMVEDA